jgi:hypothetical protein
MEQILDFLFQNSQVLNITFLVTIVLMVALFVLSIAAPYGKITKTLPLTIMFHPKENLDLDLQSVGYAMMHTTWLARISHYTIFFGCVCLVYAFCKCSLVAFFNCVICYDLSKC